MLPPPELPLKEGPPQREERPAFERRVRPICHLYLLIPACCMQQHLASFPAWHARRQRGFAVPTCSCAFPPAPPPATGPLCGAFFVPSAGRSPVAAGPGAFLFSSSPLFSSFPGHAPPSGASLGRRRAPVRPAERGLYSCRNAPFLFVPPLSQKRRARQIPLILRVNSATLEEVKKKPPHVPPLYCGKGTLCEHRQ